MNINVTAGVPFFLPTFRIVKNNNFLEMESSFFILNFELFCVWLFKMWTFRGNVGA